MARFLPRRPAGLRQRTTSKEVALRVKMLDGTHLSEIVDQAQRELGSRYDKIGPLDFSVNPAAMYVSALAKAHSIPAGVSGAPRELLDLLGDSSSRGLIDQYRRALPAPGMDPMPTQVREQGRRLERYLVLCGYAGIYCDWSSRAGRPTVDLIKPDSLALEYELEDPSVPSRYIHAVRRPLSGTLRDVVDVYDLTDPERPTWRTYLGDQDVTLQVHGTTYDGDDYPARWRYADGSPLCPIVVYGVQRDLMRHIEVVDATLRIAIGWSWWWAGLRDACHKGRNVRGMRLSRMDSYSGDGGAAQQGLGVGPEDVCVWEVNPGEEAAAEHWQWDSPFDSKAHAESLILKTNMILSQLGVVVETSHTGGDPVAHMLDAGQEQHRQHYDTLRDGDQRLLRVAAAQTNRELGTDYPEGPVYGLDYYEEVRARLQPAPATAKREEEPTHDRPDPADPERP